jgi:hypothetical protein
VKHDNTIEWFGKYLDIDSYEEDLDKKYKKEEKKIKKIKSYIKRKKKNK